MIILPERLDTAAASEFLDTMQNHVGDYMMDGQWVQYIGGKCLIILLKTQEKSKNDDREFQIMSPSDVLRTDIEFLGLSHLLLENGAL